MTHRLHCFLFAAILLLCSVFARASQTTLTGTIVDAQGDPLNGTLTMRLPFPAQDQTTNIAVAPSLVTFNLVNGMIVGGAPLYDVANLQPQGLYYIARAYDTMGALQFYGNFVVTGASFNLGQATPTSVQTSNVSYILPIFPNQTNNFTATQEFSVITSESFPVANTGWIRSASSDQACWRNVGNTNNLCLGGTENIGSVDYLIAPNLDLNSIRLLGTPLNFYLGLSLVGTITSGTGAGTPASFSCTSFTTNCLDNGGQLSITTGSAPATSGIVLTVPFGGTHLGANCTLSGKAAPATALSGATQVGIVATASSFAITSGTSALSASTTYIWNYTCTFN